MRLTYLVSISVDSELEPQVVDNYVSRALRNYEKVDPQEPFLGVVKPFIHTARIENQPESSKMTEGEISTHVALQLIKEVKNYFMVLKKMGVMK